MKIYTRVGTLIVATLYLQLIQNRYMFRSFTVLHCSHCVRFAGCCSILQNGQITLSSTPDQQLENHSTKYHRQQPLYNTLELLMMGIVVPETC